MNFIEELAFYDGETSAFVGIGSREHFRASENHGVCQQTEGFHP